MTVLCNCIVHKGFDAFAAARTCFLRISVLLLMICAGVVAYSGGVDAATVTGLKPVLGWSSWSYLRTHPSAKAIEAQARAMVSSGLEKAGYRYINVDDFWYVCPKPSGKNATIGPDVDQYGRWVTDQSRFPRHGGTNGIEAVARYVHRLGLKFGIYVTPGISKQAVAKNTQIKGTQYTAREIAEPSVKELNYNCHGMVGINFDKAGAQAYINSWADMFAHWGVDFVKLDGMTNSDLGELRAWSTAIKQSGRPMVLDVTQGSFTNAIASQLEKYADQWVPTPDIECYSCERSGSSFPLTKWANIAERFRYASVWSPYAVRGGYNDYDSIEVGNGSDTGLTLTEQRTQLSLWALESAPLIMGANLKRLRPGGLALLKNAAVIRVDQDGISARRILDPGDNNPNWNHMVFAKMEPNGDAIVGLFNVGARAGKISVGAVSVGLPQSKHGYSLDNLWAHVETHAGDTISAIVAAHGVALYRVRPVIVP